MARAVTEQIISNDDLDAAVLKEIKREPMFAKLLVLNLSEDYPDEPDLYRAVDRSLQRLREAGTIYFDGRLRRWRAS